MARPDDGTIRIYLVDDHELARRGLEAILSTDPSLSVIGGADDCTSGLDGIRRGKPDIVLMDIRMPGIDGLACLEQVKLLMPQVAVVIVTLYDDRGYLVEALRLGAAGYLRWTRSCCGRPSRRGRRSSRARRASSRRRKHSR